MARMGGRWNPHVQAWSVNCFPCVLSKPRGSLVGFPRNSVAQHHAGLKCVRLMSLFFSCGLCVCACFAELDLFACLGGRPRGPSSRVRPTYPGSGNAGRGLQQCWRGGSGCSDAGVHTLLLVMPERRPASGSDGQHAGIGRVAMFQTGFFYAVPPPLVEQLIAAIVVVVVLVGCGGLWWWCCCCSRSTLSRAALM